jgi:hypothetical protein
MVVADKFAVHGLLSIFGCPQQRDLCCWALTFRYLGDVLFIERYKHASPGASPSIYLRLRMVSNKTLIATLAVFNTDFDCLVKS